MDLIEVHLEANPPKKRHKLEIQMEKDALKRLAKRLQEGRELRDDKIKVQKYKEELIALRLATKTPEDEAYEKRAAYIAQREEKIAARKKAKNG
jgi:hypothetical protein